MAQVPFLDAPAVAPDNPESGALRVAFPRKGKVATLEVAAGTTGRLDLRSTELAGRWAWISVEGGDAGFYFEAVGDDAVDPDLAARPDATPAAQCGRLSTSFPPIPGFVSSYWPILAVTAGASDVVVRLVEAHV